MRPAVPIFATKLNLPYYSTPIKAGFPSPADDHVEKMLDLNEHLIQHPAATFYLRVSGSSMIGAGINDGDLLIVDRSLAAAHNHIVVAIVNSEFTVKRLYSKNGKHALLAENPEHPPIHLTDSDSVEVWGVVLHVIHSLV